MSSSTPRTVLITGAAGFLGLHVARKFAERGVDELLLLDIAPFARGEYPDGSSFIQGDVRDTDLVDRICGDHDVDAVIHGAAALPLWEASEIYDINIRGTLNILAACERHGIDRMLFVSSTAVYGVPERHPLYEDDPLDGVGAYGESKIEAEDICRSYRDFGLCVPIIRPKTFIGIERLGVFQILYDWIESGKRIPIIGDGTNRYQLLEVEDLADAIWLATTGDRDESNDTFNIGATDFDTVADDVEAVCDYANTGARPLPTPARPVKMALRNFERLGLSPLYEWVYGTADTDSYVDVSKAQQKLGWTPTHSNAEALIRSYQWYIDNKNTIQQGTGVTHRIAWDQGILRIFKPFL